MAREGIQELLYKLCVMNGCQPDWTTNMMAVTTVLAVLVNRWAMGEREGATATRLQGNANLCGKTGM